MWLQAIIDHRDTLQTEELLLEYNLARVVEFRSDGRSHVRWPQTRRSSDATVLGTGPDVIFKTYDLNVTEEKLLLWWIVILRHEQNDLL